MSENEYFPGRHLHFQVGSGEGLVCVQTFQFLCIPWFQNIWRPCSIFLSNSYKYLSSLFRHHLWSFWWKTTLISISYSLKAYHIKNYLKEKKSVQRSKHILAKVWLLVGTIWIWDQLVKNCSQAISSKQRNLFRVVRIQNSKSPQILNLSPVL